ncbi:MAG TPA: TonB-dependent receptor, partial [Myxococcota bacterium]|nr:TonB-dependent receptor [Myxococcota bacterium]
MPPRPRRCAPSRLRLPTTARRSSRPRRRSTPSSPAPEAGLLILFLSSLVSSGATAADEAPRDPNYHSVVTAPGKRDLPADRAVSTVTRRDLDERLPRSAPDALRYEPGVFVQQTGHGQGSAYLRGLTGQQTLMLFDGIRMNNATYRQGPNQYFFTLDTRTIRSIEVQRGGGSTVWGSDALGGIIDAHPVEPGGAADALRWTPKLFARGATADSESGGRLQLDTAWRRDDGRPLRLLGGVGARRVGRLRGRPVLNPNPDTPIGPLPWVPRYAEYDPLQPYAAQADRLRTQLGTGFNELTADLRLVMDESPSRRLTLAGYGYRQYDSPRTDQCPPPTAPTNQCLVYEEQFRHFVYAALEDTWGPWTDSARLTVSWQDQHERRRRDLTAANVELHGVDDVETWGVTARARGPALILPGDISVAPRYGVDTYFDWVRSHAQHTYTDTHDTIIESRGQYINHAMYLYGG